MSRDISFIAELIQQKESIQIEFVGDYNVPQIMKVICAFDIGHCTDYEVLVGPAVGQYV